MRHHLTLLAVMAQTTALTIPRLGLGSAEGPPHEAMASAVDAAVRSGVLMIDTAQNYGSESAIGDGLRRSGRDDVFVLCKVDLCTRSREDPRRRMRRQVTESKRKLGRVDAVALHWPILLDAPASEDDARAVRADAWRELEAMVDEGLVGCLGLSNFDVELMDEILAFARHRPVLNEVEVNPRCFQAELMAACEARGVRVVGYSPYGTCWLAKYFPSFVPWPAESVLDDATVAAVAAEAGCTPAQACVAWAMAKGAAPIPKSLDPERVRATARCLDDVALTADQVARLDALRDPRRGVEASLAAHARIIASPDYAWDPT